MCGRRPAACRLATRGRAHSETGLVWERDAVNSAEENDIPVLSAERGEGAAWSPQESLCRPCQLGPGGTLVWHRVLALQCQDAGAQRLGF